VKCDNCGGKLEGLMAFCPYCGVSQNIDLRKINFRDIDTRNPMPCPSCKTYLGAIEITVDGKPVRIERCESCQGLFFNPGELELLLDMQSHEIVWLDVQQLEVVTRGISNEGDVVYRKCPLCAERMSPHNFGGKSGVLLDRCGTHGFWLDGGEFRKLAEWWRAGGRLIYQNNESERARWLHERKSKPQPSAGSVDPGPMPVAPVDPTCIPDIAGGVFEVILGGLGDILLP
jgi:Zn-finger nucleic acid-binding protein